MERRGTTSARRSRRWRQGSWDSLWFADHFFPPWHGSEGHPSTEHRTAFEGYTLIAVAAGHDREAPPGAPGARQHLPQSGAAGEDGNDPGPGLEGADSLSRLALPGTSESTTAFGWDFPSMKERSDRFQEACELIRELFTANGPVDYNGRYYRLDQAQLSPGCYQEPHIPIMVGGTGERRTMRTLAMHGDIMNVDGWSGRGMSFELYQHKVGVLERHCENVGRDPSEIKHTLLMPLLITDDAAEAERFSAGLGHRASSRDHGKLRRASVRSERLPVDGRTSRARHRAHRAVHRGRSGRDHVRRNTDRRRRGIATRRRGCRRLLRLGTEPRIAISK